MNAAVSPGRIRRLHVPAPVLWQRPPMDVWIGIAFFILYGYSFMGKWFAYLALPVGGLLILNPNVIVTPLYKSLTRSSPLGGVSWALLFSLMGGIWEAVRGFLFGYERYPVIQILLFNVTPFYLFVGIWFGMRRPDVLRKWVRVLAWGSAIYPFAYYLILNRLQTAAGTSEIFYLPGSGSGNLIGLFAFESNLARYWFPILVAACMTVAEQIRADWLGLILALLIWGAAAKQLKRVFSIAAMLASLLLIGFIADIRIPPIAGRGGEISARETIARAVSATNPELAEEYSSNTGFYRGTVTWREHWWANIREEVSRDVPTLLLGLGYGYPLRELGQRDMQKSTLRSPHSVFYFTLAYSGLMGVALFFWLQIAILRLLWMTYKATGQIYGVAIYTLNIIAALFGNFLETPSGGTMSYLVLGLSIAPLIQISVAQADESGVLNRSRRHPLVISPRS